MSPKNFFFLNEWLYSTHRGVRRVAPFIIYLPFQVLFTNIPVETKHKTPGVLVQKYRYTSTERMWLMGGCFVKLVKADNSMGGHSGLPKTKFRNATKSRPYLVELNSPIAWKLSFIRVTLQAVNGGNNASDIFVIRKLILKGMKNEIFLNFRENKSLKRFDRGCRLKWAFRCYSIFFTSRQ